MWRSGGGGWGWGGLVADWVCLDLKYININARTVNTMYILLTVYMVVSSLLLTFMAEMQGF